MRRVQRYHCLSVLGDMKPHRYDDVIMLGTLHFANPQNRAEIWPGKRIPKDAYYSEVFEILVKRLLEYNLLALVETDRIKNLRLQHSYQVTLRDYDIQITEKGRECLGLEQVDRAGDYSYYKNFQGTLDSAKKINPGLFK